MKQDLYPPSKPYRNYPKKPTLDQHVGYCAGKSTYLYSNTEILTEAEPDEDFYEYNGIKNPKDPDYVPEKNHNNLTLQDIVDLAPPGAKLSDIRLDISFPRYMEFFTVSFYHQERNLEAEQKAYEKDILEYKKDIEKYKKETEKYNQKLADYNEWKKQKDIKNLEEQLANLKK